MKNFESWFKVVAVIAIAGALASLAIYGLVIVILYKAATGIDFHVTP